MKARFFTTAGYTKFTTYNKTTNADILEELEIYSFRYF